MGFRLRASRILALLLCHRCSCWLRTGVSVGCVAGVLAGCTAGVSVGCVAGVPGAVGPARPLAVRAASFARRVGSKPGQALRPRRRPPHWWLVACVARPGPPHSLAFALPNRCDPTNFACNSPATFSNHEFAALELQRFQTLLNLCPIELHATFVGDQAVAPPEPSTLVARGVRYPAGPSPHPRHGSRSSGLLLAACHSAIRIGYAYLDRLCASG